MPAPARQIQFFPSPARSCRRPHQLTRRPRQPMCDRVLLRPGLANAWRLQSSSASVKLMLCAHGPPPPDRLAPSAVPVTPTSEGGAQTTMTLTLEGGTPTPAPWPRHRRPSPMLPLPPLQGPLPLPLPNRWLSMCDWFEFCSLVQLGMKTCQCCNSVLIYVNVRLIWNLQPCAIGNEIYSLVQFCFEQCECSNFIPSW
jgi:hypothetical protein